MGDRELIERLRDRPSWMNGEGAERGDFLRKVADRIEADASELQRLRGEVAEHRDEAFECKCTQRSLIAVIERLRGEVERMREAISPVFIDWLRGQADDASEYAGAFRQEGGGTPPPHVLEHERMLHVACDALSKLSEGE